MKQITLLLFYHTAADLVRIDATNAGEDDIPRKLSYKWFLDIEPVLDENDSRVAGRNCRRDDIPNRIDIGCVFSAAHNIVKRAAICL